MLSILARRGLPSVAPMVSTRVTLARFFMATPQAADEAHLMDEEHVPQNGSRSNSFGSEGLRRDQGDRYRNDGDNLGRYQNDRYRGGNNSFDGEPQVNYRVGTGGFNKERGDGYRGGNGNNGYNDRNGDRPRRFDNDRTDSEEMSRMPPALFELRSLLGVGMSAKKAAWEQYKQIISDPTINLTYLDHVRMIGLLRNNTSPKDVEKMVEIYQNLKAGGFSISAPVVETIVIKAAQNDMLDVALKFMEELKTFEEPVSDSAHAGILNIYRRAGDSAKAFEYLRTLEQQGVNMHPYKRILADLHYRSGDKAKALAVFKEFVDNESNFGDIARAYGWFASNYVNSGEYDEAEALIDELSQQRNIKPGPLAFNCLARIAIARGKLAEAESYIRQEVDISRRCTFHTAIVSLMRAYLRQDNVDKAMSLLSYYRAQHERFRSFGGLQYSPYNLMIQHFAQKGDLQSMMNVFELIHAGRFNSNYVIRSMVDGYIIMNDMTGAADFLKLANRMGYKPQGSDGITTESLKERAAILKERAAGKADQADNRSEAQPAVNLMNA